MVRRERLFLTQNTLPIFDQLLDILDDIPGDVRSRVASPFFYAGLATRYESERLTEDDRDNLPERINRLRPAKTAVFRFALRRSLGSGKSFVPCVAGSNSDNCVLSAFCDPSGAVRPNDDTVGRRAGPKRDQIRFAGPRI